MMKMMRGAVLLATLLLSSPGFADTHGAEINFNSSCDFKQLTLKVKEEDEDNPATVRLDITLQSEARSRLTQLSREYLNQNMTMYINNIKISTSVIRAVLNTDSLQLRIDKRTVQKMFPGLLESQCHDTAAG